jgi:excisionase family DNA binding protein
MDEFRRRERVPLAERISLSPEEASAVTGIGLTRIREAASRGDLEAHKHGRRTIILREDLATWIRAMPKAAGAKASSENRKRTRRGVSADMKAGLGKMQMQTRMQKPVKKR